MKQPKIIKNLFDDNTYSELTEYLFNFSKNNMHYESEFGRYVLLNEKINNFANTLVITARQVFGRDSIIPSYSLFAHYEGKDAQLFKHLDNNACTYTLDMCVYKNKDWDLWVEGVPYNINENEALAYYGNEQEHWRNEFPEPNTQYVGMIFFHFVEPDHWYHSKGPSYVNVIRGNITEEEWNNKNGL
jgi:hypothetical protein